MASVIEVPDGNDPRLADYRDLRDVELRRSLEAEHGLFLAEGEKVIRRAVASGYGVRSLLMAPRWLEALGDVLAQTDAPCFVTSEAEIERLTGFHVHRGALASLTRQALPSVDDVLSGAHRVTVLEDLVDHANVGSIFRNAAALGVDAVLVTDRCADPLYRRAIKTSMGNVFAVPWTRVRGMEDALAALRAEGFASVAMTLAEGSLDLAAFAALGLPRIALVFGTEGAGVHPKTAAQVDYRVRIPMAPGVDSLNVAAAAAVAFYATGQPSG